MTYQISRCLTIVAILVLSGQKLANGQDFSAKGLVTVVKPNPDSTCYLLKHNTYKFAKNGRTLTQIFLLPEEFIPFFSRGDFSYYSPDYVIVDSCTFIAGRGPFNKNDKSPMIQALSLWIKNSKFENSGVFKDFKADNSFIEYGFRFENNFVQDELTFERVYTRLLLSDNTFKENIIRIDTSGLSCFIYNNNNNNNKKHPLILFSKRNAGISLYNYNFNEITGNFDEKKNYKLQKNFTYDSSRDILQNIDLLNRGESTNRYLFSKSRFVYNGEYNFRSDAISKTKIELWECTFENNTTINTFNTDSLTFHNCKIDNILLLRIKPNNEKSFVLTFDKTDFTKLNFDFYENMILGFPGQMSTDERNQTYSSLLEKFRLEGKTDSYQFLDIKYKEYKYAKSTVLIRLVGVLDKVWWNYGYDKKRIIFITVFALLAFYLINLSISSLLLTFYPIFSVDNVYKHGGLKRALNSAVIMFVLTIYIFFALRIEFDKINPQRTRMMVYFFFQYFFGLICLLFLFGAILKF